MFNLFNKDKRRHPRLGPASIIKCDCSYTEFGKTVELLGEISNVSKGGCLLMIYQEVVYPNTELEISFQIPSKPGVIKIHGTVVRCYRRGEEFGHYAAIRFSNEQEEGIRLLVATCK
jgi:hypothetical protein